MAEGTKKPKLSGESMTPLINFFIGLINKEARDEYGRSIGKVAAYHINPSGKIETVVVEKSDGNFDFYPAECLKVGGSSVMLLSKIKVAANKALNGANAMRERIALLKPGDDISKLTYEAKRVEEEIKVVLESIEDRIIECENQAVQLNEAINDLEVLLSISRNSSPALNFSMRALSGAVRRLINERNDLEEMRRRLITQLSELSEFIKLEQSRRRVPRAKMNESV